MRRETEREPGTAPGTPARFFHKIDWPATDAELRALAVKCRLLFALDERELAVVKANALAPVALPYRNLWGHIFGEVPPDTAPDVLHAPSGQVMMARDGWPPKLRDLRSTKAAERMLDQLAGYMSVGFDGCYYDIAHPHAWDTRPAATVDESWAGETREFYPTYAADAIGLVEGMLLAMGTLGAVIVTNSVPRTGREGAGSWGQMGERVQRASAGVHLDIAFLRGSWDAPLREEADWRYQLDTMRAHQHAGKWALYKTPAEGKWNAAAAESWFASYLLAADGRWGLAKANIGPIGSVEVGVPLADYSPPSSTYPVYLREFRRGLALVNPQAEERQVTLAPGRYLYARDGRPAPRVLLLTARTGLILLKA